MTKVNLDELTSWIRYAELDEAAMIPVKVIKSLVNELKVARRVAGYASLSKRHLRDEDYCDLVREVEIYEEMFSETYLSD
jgi:hypothetical protein